MSNTFKVTSFVDHTPYKDTANKSGKCILSETKYCYWQFTKN